jgi:hypothetical protein
VQIAICPLGSATYDAVPDSTSAAIDRLFDLVDSGVDHLDRVLNRGKQIEEKHRARRGKHSEIIDAEATPKTTKKAEKAPTVAVARKPHFYIVEAVAPTGETHFVVTDGGNARTECASREFAERILRALEKAS